MQAGPSAALAQMQEIAAIPGSPLELLEFEEADDGGLVLLISIDCSIALLPRSWRDASAAARAIYCIGAKRFSV